MSSFNHLKNFKNGFLIGFTTMILLPKRLYFKIAEKFYELIENNDIK